MNSRLALLGEKPRLPVLSFFLIFGLASAQEPAAEPSSVPQPGTLAPRSTSNAPIDKRAFGVLPNYRTANASGPFTPITTRHKFYIATKDSLDWPSYFLAAGFAGISQLDNSHPNYNQGVEGFAKRYGAGLADQVIGNYMTEAIMPTLFHEDPRYFRRGYGSKWSRTWYAATRVFVTRTDSGGTTFNFSEVVGNGTAAAIGNIYYSQERSFSNNLQRMFTQIGADSISQVLKEFWPDVKRRYFSKKHSADPDQVQ